MRTLSRASARNLILVAAAALLAVCGCGTTKSERRYSKELALSTLKRLETAGLEIGEFSIDGEAAAVDGDTIRVKGLKSSLRLTGLDTEETFKKAEERRAYAEGWEKYLKKMKGSSSRPVKMATPLGEDAKHFAQNFFRGVSRVKLERDHPGEIRDYYGRYLAYVFVAKGGQWVNYNVECVRAGMSPYFSKYAYSRRFHKEFVEAQEQARAARIGIWDPNKQHYPDYEERLVWWNARADVIEAFEKEMDSNENYFALTRWDAFKKLEKRIGQEVVLLGSVADVRLGDKGPTIVKLARNRGSDFDVVFFDKDVFLGSGIQAHKGEYVRVKGTVRKYRDKYRNVDRLQVEVTLPGQVITANDELDDALGLKGGRKVEAVPAEKGAIKPTGRPTEAKNVVPVDAKGAARPAEVKKGELPEVPNRPADGATGPLDLGDAAQADDLSFDDKGKGAAKEGGLDLGHVEETGGDLDFSALPDDPDY